MTHAIVMHDTGGPEVLKWETVEVGDPGPGQARVRHEAVGLNFIDCYHRSGLYPLKLPLTIGMEAAGVVEAVGEGVREVAAGDRVAYATGGPGSYTEVRVMNANTLIKMPDDLSFDQAAAMMLQGMTTQYLIRRTYRVKPGDTVLLHAAAGGVGLIACQWLKQLGATVIGTVGSEEKADLARAHGCDHPILYTREDVAKRVREITDGAGVPVVYDSVGQSTYQGSLDSLAPLGMFVSFGNASGPIAAVKPADLASRGSLFFTRPSLMHYTAKREDLVNSAHELFEAVRKGLKVEVRQTFALRDAADAHRALEGRRTTGSTVLKP